MVVLAPIRQALGAPYPESRMAKARKPMDRPTKVCPVCQRPFTWRKKWETVWDQVKYCSQRCRRAGHQKE